MRGREARFLRLMRSPVLLRQLAHERAILTADSGVFAGAVRLLGHFLG